MKKILLVTAFLIAGVEALTQINMTDSIVQAVTYWDIGAKHYYNVRIEDIETENSDTTSYAITDFDVELSVLNMTEDSYYILWTYSNLRTNSTDTMIQEMIKMNENIRVIYRTNEYGLFMEVLNWKEVRDSVVKMGDALRNKLSTTPEVEQTISNIIASFSSKEAIESASIKDIRQFHLFYGSVYPINHSYTGKLEIPNIYGHGNIMSDYTVSVTELDENDGNYTLRFVQEADKKQLNEAVFNYLLSLAESMRVEPPTREEVGEMSKVTEVISTFSETGWLTFSIQTQTITSGDTSRIEKQTISKRQ